MLQMLNKNNKEYSNKAFKIFLSVMDFVSHLHIKLEYSREIDRWLYLEYVCEEWYRYIFNYLSFYLQNLILRGFTRGK
jgi:hypothetical protein